MVDLRQKAIGDLSTFDPTRPRRFDTFVGDLAKETFDVLLRIQQNMGYFP
jgi:hypothetical protein